MAWRDWGTGGRLNCKSVVLHPLELTAVHTWEGTDFGKEREDSEVMSESTEMVGKETAQTSFRKNSGNFLQR